MPVNAERFKAFLFAEQDLEDLVAGIRPPAGALVDAAQALREGRAADARVILQTAIVARPDDTGQWHHLLLAAAQVAAGNREGARKALRRVLDDESAETRTRLWAWRALRRLGETPGPDEAATVLGVVVEVPVQSGLDTVAAYDDGTARYLEFTGATYLWDAPDDRLLATVGAVLGAAAHVLAHLTEGALPGSLSADDVRFTALTPAGRRVAQMPLAPLAAGEGPLAPLFATAATLVERIGEVNRKG